MYSDTISPATEWCLPESDMTLLTLHGLPERRAVKANFEKPNVAWSVVILVLVKGVLSLVSVACFKSRSEFLIEVHATCASGRPGLMDVSGRRQTLQSRIHATSLDLTEPLFFQSTILFIGIEGTLCEATLSSERSQQLCRSLHHCASSIVTFRQ